MLFEHPIPENAVSLLDSLVASACDRNASDIHIDPEEGAAHVKLRIDGILVHHLHLTKSIHYDIVGRIKILSHLRTDEHRSAQDGRFKIKTSAGGTVDIRVSVVPSYYGESVVMRLLRNTTRTASCRDLGMSHSDQSKVEAALRHTSGMILVSGPTGSGKTTTLYTLLSVLNTGRDNIITIEDPIEYALPGVRQIQVEHQRGFTFATGLRAVLRQDPDIIMVGEIRDKETAAIAVHTALTGHLLLSTIHTNDAATVIPRLMDMGVDPYLIASTLRIVIAQRLIRKKCVCAGGCEKCGNSGFFGRVGIYEVLHVTATIQDAIMSRASAQTIQAIARREGLNTLEDDGIAKVERGESTIEEVMAVAMN